MPSRQREVEVETSVGLGLSLTGVTKRFPGVVALDDVTFNARPGEIHALVGENGAGKSTLMAIAAGSLLADEGQVVVNGEALTVPTADEVRALGLAIVRQHPALLPDLSVAENLLLGQSAPVPVLQANRWAKEQLESWDSDVRIDPAARVEGLAPEHKFIVEIVKALAQRPKTLILDEPTEHLRSEDVKRLFERIRALAADGTAVVYISHRIHEVLAIADYVTVLRDGKGQGTYQASTLDEHKIVSLIAGRPLETIFPPKGTATDHVSFATTDFSGKGFDGVNVEVRRGEIIGLAGIEGNGQREFIRALVGLGNASGVMVLEGKKIPTGSVTAARHAGICYIPSERQHEGIIPDYSVGANITMRSQEAHSVWGWIQRGRQREQALASAQQFKVKTPSLEVPIRTLSGGNQQKVVLSSILASEPRVILADEPTQGVDVGTRSEIYQHLREAVDSGTAVVVLSSDALELAGLCDRVLVFSRGRVVAEHSGEDVTEPNIARAIVTSTSERASQDQHAGKFRRWMAGHSAPLALVSIGILILVAVGGMADGQYLSAGNLGGILALTTTVALVSYGQQMAMLVGGIDLSVAPLMGLIVVIESFYLIDGSTPMNQLTGWILLIVTAVAVGTVNWALIDLAKLSPVIATLATYMAIQAISLILRPVPGGYISTQLIDSLTTRVGFVPVLFALAVVLGIALEIALLWSRFGVRLRAVGSDPDVARTLGLNDRRYRYVAYVGSSLLAGLAAIPLMTQVGSGDPVAGLSYLLISVAAVAVGGASIFGGRGSFLGALLAAVLLGQVNSVTAFLDLDTAWNWYLTGAVLLLAVAAYSKSRDMAVAK
ncbi:MAG: ATP-binding cassette domain-containing protein [Nocardioidaceae bacterium]|nr:MAG: ATP-binding cassette domain-containing protein [Nocardioidaceae bacterium]